MMERFTDWQEQMLGVTKRSAFFPFLLLKDLLIQKLNWWTTEEQISVVTTDFKHWTAEQKINRFQS